MTDVIWGDQHWATTAGVSPSSRDGKTKHGREDARGEGPLILNSARAWGSPFLGMRHECTAALLLLSRVWLDGQGPGRRR
jgi:hypothetical protein